MIRRPPRSTLFPTRRSSDLGRPWSDAQHASENSRMHRKHSATSATVVSARSRGRAHRHHRGELRHEGRSEEHTSELQSQSNLVCRLLLEKKNKIEHDYGIEW